MIKLLTIGFTAMLCLSSSTVQAAPRDAGKDSGAVLKLQAMVKSLTSERDAAKAEATKLTAEIEQLKKENSKAIAASSAAKEQSDAELTAQKASNNEVRDRLEKSNAKLQDVIDKYKSLVQAKTDLNTELTALKDKHQVNEQKLGVCGEHNVKLYESAKDLLDRYQNKGTFSALLQDEPALQFNSVEMENIIQVYEDKLQAGIYKESTASSPTAH